MVAVPTVGNLLLDELFHTHCSAVKSIYVTETFALCKCNDHVS